MKKVLFIIVAIVLFSSCNNGEHSEVKKAYQQLQNKVVEQEKQLNVFKPIILDSIHNFTRHFVNKLYQVNDADSNIVDIDSLIIQSDYPYKFEVYFKSHGECLDYKGVIKIENRELLIMKINK